MIRLIVCCLLLVGVPSTSTVHHGGLEAQIILIPPKCRAPVRILLRWHRIRLHGPGVVVGFVYELLPKRGTYRSDSLGLDTRNGYRASSGDKFLDTNGSLSNTASFAAKFV